MNPEKVDLRKMKKWIKLYKNHFKDKRLYGFDTETVNGKIYSIQIVGDGKNIFQIVDGWTTKQIVDFLFRELDSGILYAHNLTFDFGVTAPDILDMEQKRFMFYNYKGTVLYPSPCYVSLTNGSKFFTFADTMPFFPMSLLKASEFVGYKTKLKRPDYLGKRKPKKKEFEYFKKYAMLDAEICEILAKNISDLHKEFDINMRYTVSIASLSSKIYRKFFQKEKIQLPSEKIIKMALLSYHGGRVEAFGYGHSKQVRVKDINSSYPDAMSRIIIPVEDKWKKTKKLSEFGFFTISGFIPKQKISPLCVELNGRLTFPCGKFEKITVTGIEAMRIKEASSSFKVHKGYVYDGRYNRTMKDFVMHFYDKKKEAKKSKDKVKYHFYKLLQNALYGKTIQLNSEKVVRKASGYSVGGGFFEYDSRKVPAGMFNPVIASWITGFARVHLYDEMKKIEPYVLYCDTDSIFMSRNAPNFKRSKALGEWDIEGVGDFYVFREKFYLLFDHEGNMIKCGRHAFRGSKESFKDCFLKEADEYEVTRMIQFKEGRIQQKQPFVMEKKLYNLKFAKSKKRVLKVENLSFKKRWYTNKPIIL